MAIRPDLRTEPYCSNCGYTLTGLTESSRCPECGKPIVEVLTRNTQFVGGKRWRSRAKLFGWPVIDIAMGPHGGQMRGVARGVIAIGDIAIGGVAFGGMSVGLVALGGVSFGACAMGGVAFGVLSAMGGLAVGSVAVGGLAIGAVAAGGQAIGAYAVGGNAMGAHTWSARSYTEFFKRYVQNGGTIQAWVAMWMAAQFVLHIVLGALIAGVALLRCARDRWAKEDTPA